LRVSAERRAVVRPSPSGQARRKETIDGGRVSEGKKRGRGAVATKAAESSAEPSAVRAETCSGREQAGQSAGNAVGVDGGRKQGRYLQINTIVIVINRFWQVESIE